MFWGLAFCSFFVKCYQIKLVSTKTVMCQGRFFRSNRRPTTEQGACVTHCRHTFFPNVMLSLCLLTLQHFCFLCVCEISESKKHVVSMSDKRARELKLERSSRQSPGILEYCFVFTRDSVVAHIPKVFVACWTMCFAPVLWFCSSGALTAFLAFAHPHHGCPGFHTLCGLRNV